MLIGDPKQSKSQKVRKIADFIDEVSIKKSGEGETEIGITVIVCCIRTFPMIDLWSKHENAVESNKMSPALKSVFYGRMQIIKISIFGA